MLDHLRVADRAAGEEERAAGRSRDGRVVRDVAVAGGLEQRVEVVPARRARRRRRRCGRAPSGSSVARSRRPSRRPAASVIAATAPSRARCGRRCRAAVSWFGAGHGDRADADRAEHRRVPGGDARQHHEDAVALADAELQQRAGGAPRLGGQLGRRVLARPSRRRGPSESSASASGSSARPAPRRCRSRG